MLKAALFLIQSACIALILHAPCSAADPADRTPIQAELVKSIEAGHADLSLAILSALVEVRCTSATSSDAGVSRLPQGDTPLDAPFVCDNFI